MSKLGLLCSFLLSTSFFGKGMKIDYGGSHMSVALLVMALVAMWHRCLVSHQIMQRSHLLSSRIYYSFIFTGSISCHVLNKNLPVKLRANVDAWYWVRRFPLSFLILRLKHFVEAVCWQGNENVFSCETTLRDFSFPVSSRCLFGLSWRLSWSKLSDLQPWTTWRQNINILDRNVQKCGWYFVYF